MCDGLCVRCARGVDVECERWSGGVARERGVCSDARFGVRVERVRRDVERARCARDVLYLCIRFVVIDCDRAGVQGERDVRVVCWRGGGGDVRRGFFGAFGGVFCRCRSLRQGIRYGKVCGCHEGWCQVV